MTDQIQPPCGDVDDNPIAERAAGPKELADLQRIERLIQDCNILARKRDYRFLSYLIGLVGIEVQNLMRKMPRPPGI